LYIVISAASFKVVETFHSWHSRSLLIFSHNIIYDTTDIVLPGAANWRQTLAEKYPYSPF
jgi:hypothetical protein